MTHGRWPQLFVVGAPRAGTSSLWDYLDQHPEIFMSRLKEPHYFGDFKPDFLPSVRDEASYLRLFAGAADGQLLGEASPTYLADPVVPAAIAGVSPEARIVAVLREPVARAHSDYWHKVRYGKETRPFLDAVRAQLADRRCRAPSPTYLGSGLYAEPLERYLDLFGDRVLVLFLDELAADTRAVVRRTLEFAGVDSGVADRMRLTVRNATSLPRNRLVRLLYRSPGLRALGIRIVPDALHPAVEGVLLRRDGIPRMDPEARRLLEDFYAPEPEKLARLLGRPVPWAAA